MSKTISGVSNGMLEVSSKSNALSSEMENLAGELRSQSKLTNELNAELGKLGVYEKTLGILNHH